MATIVPFRALRYDPARVSLSEVVTQPYDKITPEMQSRYYDLGPYNLVRIILGRRQPADDDRDNIYSRAANYFLDWRKKGIFLQDAHPSIYLYHQRFSRPDDPSSPAIERQGFIALGRIEDYDAGIVFRHEQTLAKPKADRLQLLRATRAHFGQIFMLYSDPSGELVDLLVPDTEPEVEVADEHNVLHRLWRISDPARTSLLAAKMGSRKLIIADGHHRYETALAYRNERREKGNSPGPKTPTPVAQKLPRAKAGGDAPFDYMMMTFVNMESSGLTILPTHRVVHGLANFNPENFLQQVNQFFDVDQIFGALEPNRATALLSEAAAAGATVLLAVTSVGSFLLRLRPGASDTILAAYSPLQRQLDVVQLHGVILNHVLGISQQAITEQQNITYMRSSADAMMSVREGANVAFLMNPVRAEQVRDIAFAGEVLPQKSTDFYPKLLSGLTIYALD